MSRTTNYATRRIASVRRPCATVVTCRPSMPRLVPFAAPPMTGERTVRFEGGTPELDALVVYLSVRPSGRIQTGQLAANIGFDLPRLLGAIALLVQDASLVTESQPLSEQTWVRRS